ncbi:MAG: hypothetical protein U9Q62_04600 [Campylobacterota bacterium]|nr:hypothetical protein [Campylobacterota bacterium]
MKALIVTLVFVVVALKGADMIKDVAEKTQARNSMIVEAQYGYSK